MLITTSTFDHATTSSTGAVELTFTPRRPLSFCAGQGALLLVPGGGVKPFTLTSDDHSPMISIATTLHSGSRFKSALTRLRAGDRIRVAGAIGKVAPAPEGASRVLVAQGIGITPFLSMARSCSHLDATLLQVGAPHYFDETSAAMDAAEHHEHREGLEDAVSRATAQHTTASWSLSGRTDFVNSVARQLRQLAVPSHKVHRDAFWGLGASAPREVARTGPITAR